MGATLISRRRTAAAILIVVVLVAVLVTALVAPGAGDDRQASELAVAAAQTASSGAAASVPFSGHTTGRASQHPLRPARTASRAAGTTPAVPAGPSGVSASSSTDPHHVVSDPSTGRPDIGPPDSTPLAAAAGNEPGEMLPVDGLPPGWVSSVHRFEVDRMTRAYLMVRPDAVTATKLPVVLVLHGRNETPRTIEEISQAPQVTGPAILVFPAGYGRSWDAGGCCGLAHTSHVDDVAFLTDTIHRVIAAEKDAAANRVYLLGFSNGGRMAYRMACADPGLLAGVGAVEAVPVDTCQTVTPLPIMVVAYSNDPLLTIFNGERRKTMQGYLEPTVESTVEAWRNLDGCTTAGDRAVTGSATVDTWTRCVGAGRVAFALYRGGSHRWPQATAATAATPGTPSAGNLIWAWLQRNIVVTDPVT